jgi:stress-induced morphogen
MPINIPRGKSDDVIDRMIEALKAYEADHPDSKIDIYRQNSVSVRVRIIAPDFAGQSKVERSKEVWRYLDQLPDDTQSDLSTLILLTPEETKSSFANLEFEDPVPSSL